MSDSVNHPQHYESGPFECIDLSGLYSFSLGNAIKYVWRHRLKQHPREDLNKAIWYLKHARAAGELPLPFEATTSGDACAKPAKSMLDTLSQLDHAGAAVFWTALKDCNLDGCIKAVEQLKRLEAK